MLGPLISWLSKVDPNIVLPVVFSLAAWLWHKATGKKGETVERTVKGVIGSILSEIIDHVPSQVPVNQYLAGARNYVEARIWKVLQKRGIPKNKLTERLVHMALEEAVEQLGKKIAAERAAKVPPVEATLVPVS